MTRYPANLQVDVQKAFHAAEDEDFEKAAALCCKLLDYKADPDIRMLLGTCYFALRNMQSARMFLSDLVKDFPEEHEYLIYLGMTDHALSRFEEAVKELGSLYPLSEYFPFYYTSYGDSLQQIGKLRQSRDIFHKEVEYF